MVQLACERGHVCTGDVQVFFALCIPSIPGVLVISRFAAMRLTSVASPTSPVDVDETAGCSE